MARVHTKKELAAALGISPSTLRRWLNKKYFDHLASTGYEKTARIIHPKAMAWICTHLDIEI
jgi:transposase-like protein